MENGPFIDGLPIHPMKNGDFRYVSSRFHSGPRIRKTWRAIVLMKAATRGGALVDDAFLDGDTIHDYPTCG